MLNIQKLKLVGCIFSIGLIVSACGGGTVSSLNGSGSGFTVMSTSPTSADGEIDVSRKIQAVFSTDVDQTSLNSYTFQVMETEGMSLIEGKIDYNPSTRTVTFEPYMPLTYDTPFHLMISNKIRSNTSVHLALATNVNFHTIAQPQTSTFHPDDQAVGVSPRSAVRIQFGTNIDFESFDANTFSMVETATNISVAFDVEDDADAQTIILWPEDELEPTTEYSYTISSLAANNSGGSFFGADKTITFTTAASTPFTNSVASIWDDYADSIKIASDGTLIVAGETWGALTEDVWHYDGDAFISAIDPITGEVLNTIQFGSGADKNEDLEIADAIYDMVMIGDDIYVAGFTEGNFAASDFSPGMRKMFVSKYTWNSGARSITTFTQPTYITASANIEAYAITKNSTNTAVYVVGTTTGAVNGGINKGEDDVVVVKLDTNLTQLWVKQFGTAARDIAKGVAADGNSVYIAGDTLGDFGNPTNSHVGLNPFLLQLDDATGNQTSTLFDTGTSSNVGNASARTTTGIVASNGSVYLVGTQKNTNGTSAYGLTYLSTGGVPTYASHGDTLDNEDQLSTGVYVSPIGSVYAATTRFHEMTMNGITAMHGMTEILTLNSTIFSPYKTLSSGMHASVRSMVMDASNVMYATGYVHGDMSGVMPVGMGDVFIARP